MSSPTSSSISTWPARSGCSGVPSSWLRIVMLKAAVFRPPRPTAPAPAGARRPARRAPAPTAASPPSRRMSCAIGPCATPAKPGPVERGQQHAGIAVAQVGLAPRRRRQPAEDRLGHAAGAVAAAREPHRVEAVVVGDVEEGPRARVVVAGEMSVRRRSTAGGRRSRASGPDRAAPPAPAPARQPPATCATPARRRRSCNAPCSSDRPIELCAHRQRL